MKIMVVATKIHQCSYILECKLEYFPFLAIFEQVAILKYSIILLIHWQHYYRFISIFMLANLKDEHTFYKLLAIIILLIKILEVKHFQMNKLKLIIILGVKKEWVNLINSTHLIVKLMVVWYLLAYILFHHYTSYNKMDLVANILSLVFILRHSDTVNHHHICWS